MTRNDGNDEGLAMTKELGDRPVALRALQSQIAFWAVVVLSVIFTGDALLRGRFDVALRAGLVLLFVCWCAWVLLYRMSILIDRNAVTARNLLRFTRVPWSRVADIDRRLQLRLVLDDETVVDCWGSPFAPRVGSRAARDSSDAALDTLRAAWQAAPSSSGSEADAVRGGWDRPAAVVGVILLVLATGSVLL